MRFEEFKPTIMESRVLASREPGDIFVSDGGPDMEFKGVNFYPNSGKMEEEELIDAVDDVDDYYGTITWLNNMPKTGGFGVASFDLPDGKTVHYGRFFRTIKAMHDQIPWSNNDIPGYSLQTKSGTKETAGMQPSEVLSRFDNLKAKDIVEQIATKFGKNHILTITAMAVARGSSFPITIPKPEELNFEAFRDYFCELLHPIALQRHTTTGNADEAEQQFLPGSNFADCSISFSTSKTAGLSDSILINPNGQNVKVSSKGLAGGAQASVSNIIEAIEELKDPRLLKKYKNIIDLINRIITAGVKEAPSELALHYNVINQKEAGLITRLQEMVNTGTTHEDISKGGYLTPRLQRIYNGKGVRDPARVNPHAHMVTALAFLVSDYVNNKTNFSKEASDILNNAGVVTVVTKARKTAKEWILQDFDAKFPGDAITGVLLSAQKNYASTTFRGNFTFKVLKNNANPKAFADVKPEKSPDKKSAKPTKKLSAATGGAKKRPVAKGTTQRSKR